MSEFTSTKFPTSGTNDTNIGTEAWYGPGRITADDGSQSICGISSTVIYNYLKGTAFDFAIPAESIINGIKLEIKQHRTDSHVYENEIKIVKANGSIGSENKSNTVELPSSNQYITYGGETDLWSETWTAQDINDANFGAVFSVTANSYSAAYIDAFKITVYYTDSPVSTIGNVQHISGVSSITI